MLDQCQVGCSRRRARFRM